MATEWVITAAAERVELDAKYQGEITFTVTNPGSAQDRVVFELVLGDGAAATWFPPVEEPQRLIPGGGSVSYLVKIAVPPGSAVGTYSLQGRAYSADTAPEEGSRLSGRVAFEVRPSTKPPQKPWWPYAVAAALVLVVLAVVGWLVFRSDEPDGSARPKPSPIRTGELQVPQTFLIDFDNGVVGGAQGADIFFRARTATNRNFEVEGTAKQRYLGVGGEADPAKCTGLGTAPIPFLSLEPGGILCVQTSEGRIAVATVVSRVDPSPGRIILRFELYPPV